MFCTTLRKRPEWSHLIPLLSQNQTPRWQGESIYTGCPSSINNDTERLLETHDIALPSKRPAGQPDFFRIALLSASDMQSKESTMDRLERLSNLTGGKDVGVVFLLASSPRVNGMIAYMQLQIEYASRRTLALHR